MKAASDIMGDIWEASDEMNEHRDCTVKALAVTTGCNYDACHAALKAEGRRNRCGARIYQMEKAAKRLGFTMTKRPRSLYRAKTVRTAGRDSLIGNDPVILGTAGHVAAMRDGEVIDWTRGRLHRIQKVWDIRPIATVEAPTLRNIPPPKMAQTNTQQRLF